MQPFIFNTTKSFVFQAGAAAGLGGHAAALLGPRVLCITDPGVRGLGLCDGAVASLRAAGCAVSLFDGVEPDPSLATLNAAVAAGRGVTGVLGLGGGSSMDVAKLAALLLGSGGAIDDAWGVNAARGPRLPLVLVPTTAGTGSEVTPVAIITLPDGEKRGVSSPLILPDLALLDPDLTLGLPPSITAATGVDAMVHAIEAFTTANANANPVSGMLAREALRLLGAQIETAVHDGANPEARGAMLLGAMLAGQAFANAPVAAVHALAYPLGGMFHVPHGLANALMLPHVMRFNLPAAGPAYAALAPCAFPALGDLDPQARAPAFIDALVALAARLGMPARLRDAGVPAGMAPRMAEAAMLQTRLLVNNPRPLALADARQLYEDAW